MKDLRQRTIRERRDIAHQLLPMGCVFTMRREDDGKWIGELHTPRGVFTARARPRSPHRLLHRLARQWFDAEHPRLPQ